MKKSVIASLVILFGLVVVLAVTCPDRKQHQEVLSDAMHEAMATVISEKTGTGGSLLGFGLTAIGTTLSQRLMDNILESTFTVKDYLVVSIGQVMVAGEKKTVSIGCLGHVFVTFDSEDVRRAVES